MEGNLLYICRARDRLSAVFTSALTRTGFGRRATNMDRLALYSRRAILRIMKSMVICLSLLHFIVFVPFYHRQTSSLTSEDTTLEPSVDDSTSFCSFFLFTMFIKFAAHCLLWMLRWFSFRRMKQLVLKWTLLGLTACWCAHVPLSYIVSEFHPIVTRDRIKTYSRTSDAKAAFTTKLHSVVFPLDGLTYPVKEQFEPIHPFYEQLLPPHTVVGEHLQEETYDRYNGLDIGLTCRYKIRVTSEMNFDTYPVRTVWTHVSHTGHPLSIAKKVQQRDSHRWEVIAAGDYLWYMADSTLLIPRIEDGDYGTYRCQAVANFSIQTRRNCATFTMGEANGTEQFTHLAGLFHVWKEYHSTDIDFVSPKVIVHIAVDVWTFSYSMDPIYVQHKVNGKPIEESVSEKTKCSTFGLWRSNSEGATLTKTGHLPEYRVSGWQYEDAYTKQYICLFSFCPNFDSFGKHTFELHRSFYNTETNTEDIVVEEIPYAVDLRPLLTYADTHGAWYLLLLCHRSPELLPQECDRLQSQIQDEIVFDDIFLFLLLCFMFLVWYLCYVLLRISLSSVANLLTYGSCCPPEVNTSCGVPLRKGHKSFSWRHRDRDTLHDVFLSYHCHDQAVAETVRDILVSYQLRVFDCHTDVQPGQPWLSECDRAINSSVSAVVIASCHYTKDPELSAQFHTLYYRLLAQEIPEHHLVIVHVDRSQVPPSLGPLPVIQTRHPRWRRQLESLCDDPALQSGVPLRRLCLVVVNLCKDFRDLLLSLIHCARRMARWISRVMTAVIAGNGPEAQPQAEGAEECLGGQVFATAGDGRSGRLRKKVMLSYCEESPADREVAGNVGAVLKEQGLTVVDVVQDVLAGQREVDLLPLAADCDLFVVVLSPAYQSHPLTRRLHFPPVLRALLSDRVNLDSVLLVNTTNHLHPRRADRDLSAACFANTGHTRPVEEEMDPDLEDGAVGEVPECLKALRSITWSGNLSEEDHLRQVRRWARDRWCEMMRNILDAMSSSSVHSRDS